MAADFMMGSPTALADASLESEVSYHTFRPILQCCVQFAYKNFKHYKGNDPNIIVTNFKTSHSS